VQQKNYPIIKGKADVKKENTRNRANQYYTSKTMQFEIDCYQLCDMI